MKNLLVFRVYTKLCLREASYTQSLPISFSGPIRLKACSNIFQHINMYCSPSPFRIIFSLEQMSLWKILAFMTLNLDFYNVIAFIQIQGESNKYWPRILDHSNYINIHTQYLNFHLFFWNHKCKSIFNIPIFLYNNFNCLIDRYWSIFIKFKNKYQLITAIGLEATCRLKKKKN